MMRTVSMHCDRVTAAADQLTEAHTRLDTAVALARRAGVSWAAIGAALGVTRQAAHRRFAEKTC